VLHCAILPMILVFLVAIHFWRIRKDGGLYAGPEPAPTPPEKAVEVGPR
jgi:hypothetical protein